MPLTNTLKYFDVPPTDEFDASMLSLVAIIKTRANLNGHLLEVIRDVCFEVGWDYLSGFS